MVVRRSIGDYLFDTANYLFMFIFAVMCLYPVLYMIFASFSEPQLFVRAAGILLKPLDFTLEGYNVVLKNPNILSGYINTIFTLLRARRLIWP